MQKDDQPAPARAPWAVRETCQVDSADGVVCSDLKRARGSAQNIYRKSNQIKQADVRGVPNLLIVCQRHVLKFSLRDDLLTIARATRNLTPNPTDGPNCIWKEIGSCQAPDSYFRQIESAQTWDICKTLVVARTARALVAWLVEDLEEGPTFREVFRHSESLGSLRDMALTRSGALRVATLSSRKVLSIWDLSENVDAPIRIIDLAAIIDPDAETNWNERLSTPHVDGIIPLSVLRDNERRGTSAFAEECLNCLVWLDDSSVLLGGRLIWQLYLKETVIVVAQFPPNDRAQHVDTHLGSSHRDDCAFSCLTVHPQRPWLVFALSALYHEIFVLDIRAAPCLPLAHLPLPDVYAVRAIHTSVRWLNARLCAALDNLHSPANDTIIQPVAGAQILVLPPFQEAAQGLRLHAHYFTIPSLTPPRRVRAAQDTKLTPLGFSVQSYSQWQPEASSVHFPVAGSYEYRAFLKKRLLLKTTLHRVTQVISSRSQQSSDANSVASDRKLNSKEILSGLFGAPDDRLVADALPSSHRESSGNLYGLDVLCLRIQDQSWEGREVRPSPLTVPRPECMCDLVAKGAFDTEVAHQYQFSARKIDPIGPRSGAELVTARGRRDLAECAREVKTRDGEVGGESEDLRAVSPDAEIDIFAMLNADEQIADEPIALTQSAERTTTTIEERMIEEGYCSFDARYCLFGGLTMPEVFAETGDEPEIRMSIRGLGLPINKHLINALLDAWPTPVRGGAAQPRSQLMVANVQVAADTRRSDTRTDTVQSLLGMTQMESGPSWFDTFGEGADEEAGEAGDE